MYVNNYFEYFLAFCELAQYNQVPNCNNRQLDLVLSGRGSVEVHAADEALEPVDAYHPPLVVDVPTTSLLTTTISTATSDVGLAQKPPLLLNELKVKQWNFFRADFQKLYHLLEIEDWTELYSLWDPNSVLNLFYDKINDILDTCVPLKKNYPVKNRCIYPVWYNLELIKDIKLKYRLHKKYKKSKALDDYAAFARVRARVKSEMIVAHDRYRNKVQNHLETDPKAFWTYMRSMKGNTNQQRLVKNGRELSNQECAAEFARFFHSVYNQEPATLNVSAADAASGIGAARVELGCLSPKAVYQALSRLPAKRSVGPDGIPPFILKDCRMVLIKPLLHIYNTCVETETFPDHWKLTRVVPVPKGRGGPEPSDYRPVAVLSAPAKVFELALHSCLYEQVSAQLSDAQHGFRPGRGTTGNLLHLMTRLVPAVDAGEQVDVAYFDFQKAFDTVDNDVLLAKLARIGCTPKTLAFFSSYLKDRRQYVDCGGHRSEPYYTRSGVSQGSNLGPLQFILMINDLPEVVSESTCLLYADDLKIVGEIKGILDHKRLQKDIDAVNEWSLKNNLYFNVSKCSVMTFSRARTPSHYQYQLQGQSLRRVTEVRDLGVHFSADLNFRHHIVEICKKAYRNLGFILRQANNFTNIVALRSLYDALVKSHLECNSIIWSPSESKYKIMVERVQNKFLRFLYNKMYGVYPGYPLLYPTMFVMGMVGYSKLEMRRELAMASYLFKVLRGMVHNPSILQEIQLCVPNESVCRRRRPPLLAGQHSRTRLLQRAPLTRATGTLNIVAERLDLFSCSLGEFTRVASALLNN